MPANMETVPAREVVSIQVGRVRQWPFPRVNDGTPEDPDAAWESGIFKAPATDPVRVTAQGIEGDEQADLDNHGGPDNVVLAYDAQHYPEWRVGLKLPDLAYGSFGENFTVTGFSDETVCVGDIWQVGPELQLQVTQARQPCYKLALRLGRPEAVKIVRETSRGGWYLRVLEEGVAEAGMRITLLERRHPEWTIARAVQTMYARRTHPVPAQALAALPELSTRWKQELLGEWHRRQSQQQQQ